MGRRSFPLKNKKIVDKRELGYYSTPSFVAVFLANTMLKINPNGKYVLDPAVGNEELLNTFYKRKKHIDGIDIYKHREYGHCTFLKGDFIDIYRRKKRALIFGENIDLKYDYFIFNPPFNNAEVTYIKENKDELINLFGEVGTYNMSLMFISAVIDSAKEGAVIAFISADSFLAHRRYAPLREQILNTCSIHHLILCPVDLFAEQKTKVRTCIMVLQKGTQYQKKIQTLNRTENTETFKFILKTKSFKSSTLDSLVSKSNEFVLGIPSEIKSLLACSTIGEKYKCLSGISTGDDGRFLSLTKKHGFHLPFYKNIYLKRFYAEPDRFLTDEYLELGKRNMNFILRNRDNIFKEGIVCSQVGLAFSACHKPAGAVFGMNAGIFCPKNDIWWLLAYLNSSLVTYILRSVINRSNTVSSGYVAKIPIVKLSANAKKKLDTIARTAFKEKIAPNKTALLIADIDSILFKELRLSKSTQAEILDFVANLYKRV